MTLNPLNSQSLKASKPGMFIPHAHAPNLVVELTRYSQEHYTGELTIQVQSGQTWSLYLHLGRLSWASGGEHSQRRWQRHLRRCCPKISPEQLNYRHSDRGDNEYYRALGSLLMRRVLSIETVANIQRAIAFEVLFDIMRAIALISVAPDADTATANTPFTITTAAGVRPCHQTLLPNATLINLTQILCQVETQWNHWVTVGLTHCSPDLVPVINNETMLKKATNATTFQHLQQSIDGTKTLRDLAIITQTSVLTLTRSLLPYIRQQLIRLVKVEDLGMTPPPAATTTTPKPCPYRPLIVGIDDSVTILKQMRSLLPEDQYRFVGISESTHVLLTLLEVKPDIIFLDLIMPIANGYEICSQIRRIPHFENTPIVILTGKDTIVDRLRAKMVGATDFISKPLDVNRINALINKYASCTQ